MAEQTKGGSKYIPLKSGTPSKRIRTGRTDYTNFSYSYDTKAVSLGDYVRESKYANDQDATPNPNSPVDKPDPKEAPKPDDGGNTLFEVNDVVQIVSIQKTLDAFSVNSSIRECVKYKLFAIVLTRSHIGCYVGVEYPHFSDAFWIATEDLVKVDLPEGTANISYFVRCKNEAQLAEYSKLLKMQAKELYEEICGWFTPQVRALSEQNFFEINPKGRTNVAYGRLGVLVPKRGFIGYEKINEYPFPQFVRNESYNAVQFQLPLCWTESRGYDEALLRQWFSFLKEVGFSSSIGVGEVIRTEIEAVKPHLGTIEEILQRYTSKDKIRSLFSDNIYVSDERSLSVTVELGESVLENVFLIWLIVAPFWKGLHIIPGLAMQLYEDLAPRLSRWQALLISLCADGRGILSSTKLHGVYSPCLINPFAANNAFAKILKTFQNADEEFPLSNAFEYRSLNTKQAATLVEYFRQKKFEDIFTFLSNK